MVKRKRYNISLNTDIHDKSVKSAYKEGYTFSRIIEDFLRERLEKEDKIISKHN